MREGGPGGVHAGGAVHATSGVGGGGPEVKPPDRGLGPAEAGDRPEDQLLVELGGAAVERAAQQVGVEPLHLPGTEHPAGEDPAAEAGGVAFDPGLHPVREAFAVVAVPLTPDAAVARVAVGALRDVGVGPQRLGPGRGPGGVAGRHLTGEEERRRRDGPGGHLAE